MPTDSSRARRGARCAARQLRDPRSRRRRARRHLARAARQRYRARAQARSPLSKRRRLRRERIDAAGVRLHVGGKVRRARRQARRARRRLGDAARQRRIASLDGVERAVGSGGLAGLGKRLHRAVQSGYRRSRRIGVRRRRSRRVRLLCGRVLRGADGGLGLRRRHGPEERLVARPQRLHARVEVGRPRANPLCRRVERRAVRAHRREPVHRRAHARLQLLRPARQRAGAARKLRRARRHLAGAVREIARTAGQRPQPAFKRGRAVGQLRSCVLQLAGLVGQLRGVLFGQIDGQAERHRADLPSLVREGARIALDGVHGALARQHQVADHGVVAHVGDGRAFGLLHFERAFRERPLRLHDAAFGEVREPRGLRIPAARRHRELDAQPPALPRQLVRRDLRPVEVVRQRDVPRQRRRGVHLALVIERLISQRAHLHGAVLLHQRIGGGQVLHPRVARRVVHRLDGARVEHVHHVQPLRRPVGARLHVHHLVLRRLGLDAPCLAHLQRRRRQRQRAGQQRGRQRTSRFLTLLHEHLLLPTRSHPSARPRTHAGRARCGE